MPQFESFVNIPELKLNENNDFSPKRKRFTCFNTGPVSDTINQLMHVAVLNKSACLGLMLQETY